MTSLYLEKKSREWIILVKTARIINQPVSSFKGLIFIQPIINNYIHYLEFYNPYKKLILKAEINGFVGRITRTSKKHKSGDKIKYIINNNRNFCYPKKEITSSNLNYEILISAYFTYNNFMELYNKVDYICKNEQRIDKLLHERSKITFKSI